MLKVHVEGRTEHIAVNVEREGDDKHCGQHDDSSAKHSELMVLVRFVMEDMSKEHSGKGQPED